MRIRWLKKAATDLEDLYEYIASGNPNAAGKEVEKVVEYVELLRDNPAMGRAGRVPHTRELVIPGTPYITAYRIKNNVLEILRVIHGARKWPTRF
ncbi:MAG: type II toxin-antitoxin system RelE/ParE family toxin [Candidatus Aminicenantes bacterium]|nr:type II toxin-antitoxin system RelE/ParE family toxin [Candidatus Aminicenantes bacterium]